MTTSYEIVTLGVATSTNDEAMAQLRAGTRTPFVVTAREQTGGRGRHGRIWASPPGNLYMSLALRDPAPPACAPQLGFVAGVALAETLRPRVQGGSRLRLKWPNDVLHNGAKLAGTLLESATLPGGGFGCVIGIGVNCNSHPSNLSYAATDLAAVGGENADPDVVLKAFLRRFDVQLKRWSSGADFAAIRRAWLGFAAGLGEPITVTTSRCRLDGIFRDLDATGRLLLDTAAGEIAIDAGDVFFPTLAVVTNH